MYVTVLDFTEGRVFQYDIWTYELYEVGKEYPTTQQIEDFLVGKGHRMNDCEWMSHSDWEIITDKAEI